MKNRVSAFAYVAPLLLLAACGKAAAPAGESVATVNGKPVSKSQFELYLANIERQTGGQVTEEQKSQLLDQFISMGLAAEAAEKAGVAKDPKVVDQIELSRLNVVVDAGIKKYFEENPVRDDELKPEYDAQVAAMPREYHARHILVDDKAQADALTAQLNSGGDFAKLAKHIASTSAQ